MLTIGFANKFYTLWDVSEETVYFTDAYGKHHPSFIKTHYHYIKNISFDLTNAKELYPNANFDENLKGKSRDFIITGDDDLSPSIMKGGKHAGKDIAEIVKIDFGYILWLLQNSSSKKIELCMQLPEVTAHFLEEAKKSDEVIASYPVVESGISKIFFETNPNYAANNLIENRQIKDPIAELIKNKYYAIGTIGEGHNIYVFFDEIKEIRGIYPFSMAYINGVPKKLKRRTFSLHLDIIYTDKDIYGVTQYALSKSW